MANDVRVGVSDIDPKTGGEIDNGICLYRCIFSWLGLSLVLWGYQAPSQKMRWTGLSLCSTRFWRTWADNPADNPADKPVVAHESHKAPFFDNDNEESPI